MTWLGKEGLILRSRIGHGYASSGAQDTVTQCFDFVTTISVFINTAGTHLDQVPGAWSSVSSRRSVIGASPKPSLPSAQYAEEENDWWRKNVTVDGQPIQNG
jgi:hypothetical protein